MKPSQELGFFVSGPGTFKTLGVRRLAATKVYGVALRLIEGINKDLSPELIVHRLSKLRRMFKTEQLVWQALEQYGKKEIVKKAVEINRGSLVSTSRR